MRNQLRYPRHHSTFFVLFPSVIGQIHLSNLIGLNDKLLEAVSKLSEFYILNEQWPDYQASICNHHHTLTPAGDTKHLDRSNINSG